MPHDSYHSPIDTVRVLRRELATHNLSVILLALLTLGAVIVLWGGLHVVAAWLTLLFLTATKGEDIAVPRGFDEVFWCAVAGLLAVAWIDRRFRPDDRPRDHHSVGEIVFDLVLAIPRMTLGIWGTLSAWQHLSRRELAQAAALVEQLSAEHRLRLQSLPLEIPDSAARFKILFALQLVQIIDVRRENREYWVTLNPLRPAALRDGGRHASQAAAVT